MRPLSVGELLDASFAALRRNFKTLVLCTLVAVVPVAILDTLVQASTTENAFDFSVQTTIAERDFGAFVAGRIVSGLLSLLATSLATAACLRAVGAHMLGTPVGARESLRHAGQRIGPLLWVTILYTLSVLAGLLLLFVGAIWLGVLFALATPALLFEEHRGMDAMRRSRALIADHWWRVFGVLVVMYLIVFVLQAVLVGVVTGVILLNSESEVLNAAILTAANILSLAISLPLLAALFTYVYFDLRVRKEGFDLQLLAEGIGPQAQAPSPVEGLSAPDRGSGGPGGFLPPQPP